MPSLLTAMDFPRWTKGKLGLPANAELSVEIDRFIIRAEDHVRSLIGDGAFNELAADGIVNADQRRRFSAALHAFVESELYAAQSQNLSSQVGSSSQGGRSKTITADSAKAATSAASRSYEQYASMMFNLGYSVRAVALNMHYTHVTR